MSGSAHSCFNLLVYLLKIVCVFLATTRVRDAMYYTRIIEVPSHSNSFGVKHKEIRRGIKWNLYRYLMFKIYQEYYWFLLFFSFLEGWEAITVTVYNHQYWRFALVNTRNHAWYYSWSVGQFLYRCTRVFDYSIAYFIYMHSAICPCSSLTR